MRTELFYYLVVGAAGFGLRLWLERSMRPVIAGRRAPERGVPPPRFEADPRRELESIASALDLSIERTGSAAAAERLAADASLSIQYRVGGSLASCVRIERSGARLPPFVLLPHPDAHRELPGVAWLRVRELLLEPTTPPFVGWAPPEAEGWAAFSLAARRVSAEVELLEHADGVITAWIVSWSPQHAIEQVRRIQRFAQLAPAAGPYR